MPYHLILSSITRTFAILFYCFALHQHRSQIHLQFHFSSDPTVAPAHSRCLFPRAQTRTQTSLDPPSSPPPFSPPIRQIEVGPCICRHPGPGYRERHLSRPKPPQTLPRSCNQPLRFPLPATLPSTSAPHPRRSSQTCSSQTMGPSPLTRRGGGSGRPGPIFSGFDRLEWACPRLVLEFGRGFGGAGRAGELLECEREKFA